MSDLFKAEFEASYRAAQREREAHRDRLWAEREAQVALIEAVVQGFQRFGYAVEVAADTKGAVQTGVFQQLVREGYAKTTPVHVTEEKLREGGPVWIVEWLTPQVLAVDAEQAELRAAESRHRVTLTMKVDMTGRTVDTEFYSWNARSDSERNLFEDTEKLHVVWAFPEGSEDPRIQYIGFGSNEPHDLEHPAKLDGTYLAGKPRFYIFDVARDLGLFHEVTWVTGDLFDWDWSYVPIREDGLAKIVEFVRFPDGTMHCLSDRYLARAAAGMTRDTLLASFWSGERLPGTVPCFDELGATVRARFSELFVRVRATVRLVQGKAAPVVGSSFSDVLERARRDYLAYFVATAGVEARSQELMSAWKRLGGARGSEYEKLFDSECGAVFASRVAGKLPARLRDVIAGDLGSLEEIDRVEVEQWRATIIEELRADLYFYGQFPDARVGRLLFAIGLATGEDYGNIYGKLLAQCGALLAGRKPHGCFDPLLPNWGSGDPI